VGNLKFYNRYQGFDAMLEGVFKETFENQQTNTFQNLLNQRPTSEINKCLVLDSACAVSEHKASIHKQFFLCHHSSYENILVFILW
jgi:hypothetical protein